MESLSTYFLPVLLGYGIPCLLWYLLSKYKPSVWPIITIEKPEKPGRDLIYGLLAVFGILGIGQLWSAGLLIPYPSSKGTMSVIVHWLNNLIIYSPVFIVLFLRKQSLHTIFLGFKDVPVKLVFGGLSAIVGVELYMVFNGGHAGTILTKGLDYENIRNFLPVFLEGVALAFLFVRLKWTVGLKWAIAIPAILFSLAHIPRAINEESPLDVILIDSVLTALVTVVVFSTTAKSRDIIWLGVLHYFLDIAIGAFN